MISREALIAWIDTLLSFVCLCVLMLALASFTKLDPKDDPTKPPGNLSIELTWAQDRNVDVDLWVRTPVDNAVGYSAKSGRAMDLLRDDLGYTNDPSNVNFEIAFSRGIVPGRYVINAHVYHDHEGREPVPVTVVVYFRADANASAKELARATTTVQPYTEQTILRFVLDAQGNATQIDHIPTAIRNP